MSRWPYMLLIFAAGISWPLQAAVNARLKQGTGQPLAAVMVNGGGAAVLAGLAMIVLGVWAGRIGVPTLSSIQSVPWWAYLGGVFSVLVIVAQSTSAVPLGAALLVTLFVAGQGLSSLVFDQFGLLGFDRRPVSLLRFAGVGLLLFGGICLALDGRNTSASSSDTGAKSVTDAAALGRRQP